MGTGRWNEDTNQAMEYIYGIRGQLIDQWHNDRIDHEWRQCYDRTDDSEP